MNRRDLITASATAKPLTAEDYEEIQNVLAHYLHCIDHFDYEGVADCFTEDGFYERREPPYAPGGQSGRRQGREKLIAWAKASQANGHGHGRHHLTNTLIKDMGDGETAWAASSWFYTRDSGKSGEPGGPIMMAKTITLTITAMCWDKMRKVNGRWLIAEEWSRDDPQPDKFDPWTGVAL